LAVLGWIFNIPVLKSVFPGFATMKINTALCFVGTAAFIAMLQRNSSISDSAGKSAATLATLVGVVGLLSLLESIFDFDAGIDELLVHDSATLPANHPGRMSPATASCFLLYAGSALVQLTRLRFSGMASQGLCGVGMLISGVALLGYLYGVNVLGPRFFTTMAVHTASLFVLLGGAILLSSADNAFPRIFSSSMTGSRLARGWLPFVVLFPAVLGWLILQGVDAGLYSPGFSHAVNTILTICALMLLLVTGSTVLDRAEEYLYQTVESAPTAMVMIKADGIICMVNALTEAQFGYHRGELLGQPVEKLIPGRFRGEHPALRDGFFHTPSARTMGAGRELYALRKDGTEFPVEIGLAPIRTQDGIFVLAAIADITWRKQATDEIKLRSEELARSNRDLEQFAYIASHDLQEPLRAVSGCVQILQRRYQSQLDARADEFIKHAVDGTTRMQTLIDDLLKYSRVGRQQHERKTIDVAQALQAATQNLQVALREAGTQLETGGFPEALEIPFEFVMLFQNLLANAIKFRKPDIQHKIVMRCEKGADCWSFSVADNGIGIDSRHFERIFDIFQRLHPISKYPGTGIGLALCKRIVEMHGGKIAVESVPDQGATFTFTLPYRWRA